MTRTFRYPLQPTKIQEAILDRWLLTCQRFYNSALEERREAYRRQRVSITRYDQQKELTKLRRDAAEYRDIPVTVMRSPLRRLERAFQGFFQRVKTGKTPGYPRFKSRDRYDSFSVGRVAIDLAAKRIRIPKLGDVKVHLYRPLGGEVLDIILHRSAKGWYACVACDVGEAPPKVAVRPGKVVGIDVGLTKLATLSDGGVVENPRYFREAEEQLARRQRILARRKRDSRSRRRAKRLVARSHEHIKNQRLDYARKVAKQLVNDYDLIVHEDLQIARMVRGNLAKSIHDAAWGVLLRCIACKAEEAGKHVIAVDPRGTSQRCSMCGTVVSKDLSIRVHACPSCGYTADRDLNAARNILALGLSAPEAA